VEKPELMLYLKNCFILTLFICALCFISCNKTDLEAGTLEINQSWELDSDFSLFYRDAALYQDTYLVWGLDINENPLLIAYDIANKELAWLFDFSNISGWGTKLNIVDNYLVVKENNKGITVIDLDFQQTTAAIRFASDFPNQEVSDTPVSVEENKIFFTVTDPVAYKSRLLAINLPSGNVTEEFVYQSDDFMIPKITSPSFFENNDNEINSLVTIQLKRTDLSVARTSATVLLSLDEGYNTNWLDTIDFENGTHPIKWLPIVSGSFMAVTFIDELLVYNVNTGNNLLQLKLPKASGSKLRLKDGSIFYAQGQSRSMQKLDITNGSPMWALGSTPAPAEFGDILIKSNQIVYVRESFGNLTVIDNQSGFKYNVLNQFPDGTANPNYSDSQQVYVSHQADRLVGFTLEEK